ncbi:MAG TPA: hypothetical protein VKI64_07735 [Acidimicrobiales bacterium]|nr:hypothetical protein [Acidimicrobiales bacterium]
MLSVYRRLLVGGTVSLVLVASLGPRALAAGLPATPPVRTYEPVVLSGSQFPDWSAGPEVTARAPGMPTNYPTGDAQALAPGPMRSDCYQAHPQPDVNGWVDPDHGDHSCYQSSQLPARTVPGRTAVDTGSLRGYRWDGSRFVQIPFQVDTKWVHYLSNNASGFAFYSGIDQETTYTFDREGFRFTTNRPFDPANPSIVCWSQPAGGRPAAPDPNPGLIDTDEMAFMARDAGTAAPRNARPPHGIVEARRVTIIDPITGAQTFVYVMRSGREHDGSYTVGPAFTAANSPYVRYQRDANADLFGFSQSSYSDYGNAPKGPVCNPDGTPAIGRGFRRDATGAVVLDPSTFVQRRPLDGATVTTPRYRFRYDGRWLMDGLQVSPGDTGLASGDYGPSIVDRWKARAFQQSPGGQTPCCGYEEEQTNWGGSSQLLGEKAGPVRVIRETWGADSATNATRTEVFYAEEVDYLSDLRVHPIPPLDGIYVQRDMAAGRVTHYYNPYLPAGAPVDGLNDEAYGNFHAHVGPDGVAVDSQDRAGDTVRSANGGKPLAVGSPNDGSCGSECIHGDFDVSDTTFSGPPGLLQWEEVDGPAGALVERWTVHQATAGGVAEALVTQPYYRDDSCFDDGTGADPGPKLRLRSSQEPSTWGYDPVTGVPASPAPPGAPTVYQRRCWNHHADGSPYNLKATLKYDPGKPAEAPDPPPDPSFSPQGDIRYYQGDIGTHGLHLTLVGDSDNAQLTVPVDEIDSQQTQVVLHGNQGNVGEQYGRAFDRPLIVVVAPPAPGGSRTGAGSRSAPGGAVPASPAAAAAAGGGGPPSSARAGLPPSGRPARGAPASALAMAMSAMASAGGLGLALAVLFWGALAVRRRRAGAGRGP